MKMLVNGVENIRPDSCQENLFTEDFPPENGFRGFEMIPRVLCKRIDITPYLNKQKSKKPVFKMKSSSININVTTLLQQCSVILMREDLYRLKKMYSNNINKNSLINISTPLKKCKICEKVYTNEKKLQNHVENKHMVVYKAESKPQKRVSFSDQVIVHELKEYHHCRKCPKVFEDYQSLKTHMKQLHKKRKCYICFYCNKDFVDRMFFKVHIKMHCNMCGKFFTNKKNYNDHRRTVCRILKKYQCKTCNEIYFSFLSLKDHSYDHEGVIFVCDICKERLNSKCKLLHHIQFLHCKIRPKTLYDTVHVGTDIMYECNSCDQCSNNKETMEEHTISLPDLKDSVTTSYKDYYFCDQCSEQFDTETKMLRHKWTHFLKDNEKSCEDDKHNVLKKDMKMIYKIGEELPLFLQPKLVLKKLETPKETIRENVTTDNVNVTINNNQILKPTIDLKSLLSNMPKKAIIDPVSKKTIISKHQCEVCKHYFSSKYCLRRHIQTTHEKKENLQCNICEEIFVWPSLLKTHNCIRTYIPEMPFQDARPEIQFDNLQEYFPNGNINDMSISQDDFDIPPAPIVELTEFENVNLIVNNEGTVTYNTNSLKTVENMRYRITMQEVPIEF